MQSAKGSQERKRPDFALGLQMSMGIRVREWNRSQQSHLLLTKGYPMVRPLRIDYPDAWHHVTCRGNEKKKIFSDDREPKADWQGVGWRWCISDITEHDKVILHDEDRS
jgi:hypothetical protein